MFRYFCFFKNLTVYSTRCIQPKCYVPELLQKFFFLCVVMLLLNSAILWQDKSQFFNPIFCWQLGCFQYFVTFIHSCLHSLWVSSFFIFFFFWCYFTFECKSVTWLNSQNHAEVAFSKVLISFPTFPPLSHSPRKITTFICF